MKHLNPPGLANVNDIDSIRTSLVEVWLHVNLQVLGSEVGLSCEEHLNILGSGIENWGELRRSHLCDLTGAMSNRWRCWMAVLLKRKENLECAKDFGINIDVRQKVRRTLANRFHAQPPGLSKLRSHDSH